MNEIYIKKNFSKPSRSFFKTKWEVQELVLGEVELIEALKYYLLNVMEGILDPDIAGKNQIDF
ncbi:MAG: hypothetical protein FH761_18965 [Firmicutes bacterium]|nr:hypothetical protein [Bacillota bacterium]